MFAAALTVFLIARPDLVVPMLGNDDYQTRETATVLLKMAGRDARPALTKAAASDCPETRSRAFKLLDRLHHQHVNSFRPFPPIDGMWYCDRRFNYVYASDDKGGECAEANKKYAKYLQFTRTLKLTSADGDYPEYRRAFRMVVEEWIAEGKADEWIREQVAETARRDLVWRKKNNINNINGTNRPAVDVPMQMPALPFVPLFDAEPK